ncbi:calcium-binding protein [Nocardioides dongkuii]|uniref:calcium-binding protein n=1 Tax=Nocardioides dongkuii TaxID=2760089 RepID=UPI001D0CBFB4|nr:calcium-binding protein [Nocardioides dongkuii]
MFVRAGLGAATLVLAGLVVTPAGSAESAADPTCAGKTPTIVVPAGATGTVTGTEGDDVIHVVKGRNLEVVDGLAGHDTICATHRRAGYLDLLGGDGDDELIGSGTLSGGPGNDVIRGMNADNGPLSGGEGDDLIVTSGDLSSTIEPGAGDDTIVSGTTNGDTVVAAGHGVVVDAEARTIDGDGDHDVWRGVVGVRGTRGHDVFRGSERADHFWGQDGGDLIDGRGGDDGLAAVRAERLHGGSGDDVLTAYFGGPAFGGSGRDEISTRQDLSDWEHAPSSATTTFRLSGGRGADTFKVGPPTVDYRVVKHPSLRWRGVIAGGPGEDRFILEQFIILHTRLRADLRTGVARFTQAEAALRGIESLVGGPKRDVLRGGPGSNTLIGKGGRDRLVGGPGRDVADGGRGVDTCQAELRRSCERR